MEVAASFWVHFGDPRGASEVSGAPSGQPFGVPGVILGVLGGVEGPLRASFLYPQGALWGLGLV